MLTKEEFEQLNVAIEQMRTIKVTHGMDGYEDLYIPKNLVLDMLKVFVEE